MKIAMKFEHHLLMLSTYKGVYCPVQDMNTSLYCTTTLEFTTYHLPLKFSIKDCEWIVAPLIGKAH